MCTRKLILRQQNTDCERRIVHADFGTLFFMECHHVSKQRWQCKSPGLAAGRVQVCGSPKLLSGDGSVVSGILGAAAGAEFWV